MKYSPVFQTPGGGGGLRRRTPGAPIGATANGGNLQTPAPAISQPEAPATNERDWQGISISELKRLFPRGIFTAQALEAASQNGRRWFFASAAPFAPGAVPEYHFTISETVSGDLEGTTETPMFLLQQVVAGNLQIMVDSDGEPGRFLIAYPGASSTTGSESAPVMF